MKVLITGGTGFLGPHIKEEFKKYPKLATTYVSSKIREEHIRCDLTNFKDTMETIYLVEPDVVLHMAALAGGILANRNSPADFLTVNLKMGINVFEAVRDYNNTKDVNIYTLGSVCSYPRDCPVPFKEDDLWNGFPEKTNSPYGHGKRTLLMLQNSYRKQYGIKGAHLIPVNLYGPHDHFDLTNSHVIPALIRKFTEAVDNKQDKVELWGTGQATREFLYAKDCAQAVVQAVNQKLDTDLPINVGTGRDISIHELAEQIAELCGYKGKIVYDSSKPDGQPKRRLDVSRAEELLGFKAETTLLKGLVETICWYQENKD